MKTGALSLVAVLALLWSACRASNEEIARVVDERIATVLAQVPTETAAPTVMSVTFPPTPTPQPTVTPRPTVTPQAAPTPHPPPTPQPTATPLNSFALWSDPSDFNLVYRHTFPSVFLIKTTDRSGSGWLHDEGLILTSFHIVGNDPEVTVHQDNARPFVAKVLAVDRIRDIALLSFSPSNAELDPRAKPVPLGSIGPNDIATSLLALGYSGSSSLHPNGTAGGASANAGILSSIVTYTKYGHKNLVIDAAVDPGDSGGPVVNRGGSVVGMNRAAQQTTVGGQRVVGTFYAVHVDEIRAALTALLRGESR